MYTRGTVDRPAGRLAADAVFSMAGLFAEVKGETNQNASDFFIRKRYRNRSRTANTLVFMRGEGIILREPSVVAVDTRTDTVRYVGQEAKDVIAVPPVPSWRCALSRTASSRTLTSLPICCRSSQEGDQQLFFSRPNVVVCIPSGVTAVSAGRFGRPPSRQAPARWPSSRSRWLRLSVPGCRWRSLRAAW